MISDHDAHARGELQRPSSGTMIIGPLAVTPDELRVAFERDELWLRPREMEILAVLAANPGRIVTRAAVIELIDDDTSTARLRSIDFHVVRLRRRLAMLSPGWEYIFTHHRDGYRFEPTPRSR